MKLLYDYNVIIDLVGVAIVCIVMLSGPRLYRGGAYGRLFGALTACILTVLLSDIPAWIFDGARFRGARALLWGFNTIYYTAQALFCYLWLLFALSWNVRSDEAIKRKRAPLAIPMLAELALIASNPWTGWVFSINSENVYSRGSLYYLNLLPYVFYIGGAIALTAVSAMKTKDTLRRRQSLLLLLFMSLPAFCAVLDSANYGLSSLWPFTALLLMMIYLNDQQQAYLSERLERARMAERAAALEKELTESRIAVMLSQIQPHFLYNALCVIQGLCHGKAPEAERAAIEFSEFLRGNLDSLKMDKPIPFRQELKHTQNYISLEQKRFDERLKVEYDIQTELFRIPALTLQPIVENAIRYGVTRREEGGRVKITAAENDSSFTVTVEDDGVGFDVYAPHGDGRTHIGIDNVRQRLREMCGGELEINSVRDVGTTAVLKIPKGGEGDEDIRG